MSAKSKKIDLSEEFIAMWREEQCLWDFKSPLHQDRNTSSSYRCLMTLQ